jgi:heavy metal sensor kinase
MLAVLGVSALVLLDRGLRDNIDASLKSVAQSIAESSRRQASVGTPFDDLLDSMLPPGLTERFFSLLDPFGRPDPRIASRSRLHLPLSVEALRNAEQGRETYQTLPMPGMSDFPVRMLTLPVIERGRIIHLVQVAMPLESAEAARSRFLLILLTLAPLALGGVAAGGWFLAGRTLAPVDRMVDTARKIEAEDLSQRIETGESNDELGRLARVLNDMLMRLESSFAAVRHFSADAAHELRTPLTILKGEIEVALRAPRPDEEYRRVLRSCLEEVDRLSTLVQDLLFLARSDSGNMEVGKTPVNVGDVVADVAPSLQALAETTGVTFTVAATTPVWVEGNASMLFRLLFNLGENAIKYTPAGGTVEVALQRNGHEATLEVRDTGSGIPSEEQSHIFDRFYRSDPARSRGGTGLGLALARSIVFLHHGHIAVESIEGRGSCFRVVLPLAAPTALPAQLPHGQTPDTPP